MTIYYTYYSYEEFGRGYIGYRKCPEKYTPETDPYLGSYTDKKFKPTHKIILGTYNNPADAIADEIVLHKAYDVAANSHFANRAKQTSVGFSVAGTSLPLSAEHRAKLSEAHQGLQASDETRAKMSAAQRGKTLSAETKAKMSEAHRGKQISAETRAKLSEANRGKRPSDETVAKRSEANRGRKHSAETKAKISEAHRGKQISAEQRAKISEALCKKSKRFNWKNTHTGALHYNISAFELVDLYVELDSCLLRKVANGKQTHHKGWIVQP